MNKKSRFSLMANSNGNIFKVNEKLKEELIKSHIAKNIQDEIDTMTRTFVENNLSKVLKRGSKRK